jgi:pimeloyl-ACP methyl ester carboxylesterase
MNRSLPLVLIPGLLGSPDFYAEQIPTLWRYGPVTIADHTRDDTMAAIASRILSTAPPRFALVGHSMGGYAALEIVRRAPDRVDRIALLDSSARPDTAEKSERRRTLIKLATGGHFDEIADLQFQVMVHPARLVDDALRHRIWQMADDTGAEAFARQQMAIMGRADLRPSLAAIGCPALILLGDRDDVNPADRSAEMAEAIAAARLVVIAQCGHMSAMEQPDAVTQALVEWRLS